MAQALHPIWPALPPAKAHEILSAVQKGNKKLYRTTLELMAKPMGLRVPLLLELPKIQRHQTWQALLGHPEMEVLGFNLLSSWLIETQVPMLAAWLDSFGIAHDAQGCAEEFPPEPAATAQAAAIEGLLARFDPLEVAIYLRCFNHIDGTHWVALDERIDSDPRLALPEPALA